MVAFDPLLSRRSLPFPTMLGGSVVESSRRRKKSGSVARFRTTGKAADLQRSIVPISHRLLSKQEHPLTVRSQTARCGFAGQRPFRFSGWILTKRCSWRSQGFTTSPQLLHEFLTPLPYASLEEGFRVALEAALVSLMQ